MRKIFLLSCLLFFMFAQPVKANILFEWNPVHSPVSSILFVYSKFLLFTMLVFFLTASSLILEGLIHTILFIITKEKVRKIEFLTVLAITQFFSSASSVIAFTILQFVQTQPLLKLTLASLVLPIFIEYMSLSHYYKKHPKMHALLLFSIVLANMVTYLISVKLYFSPTF